MDARPEFLDLDNDLDALLSNGGKNYLAQLGIEEYHLESPETTNPGKYYDNVPLEDNPEAYLDLLSRESLRRKNGRPGNLSNNTATAPKKPVDASLGRPKAGGRRLQRSLQGQATVAAEASNKPAEASTSSGNAAGKSASQKRVSFNEQLSQEIPPQEGDKAKGKTGPSQKKKWKIKTLEHLQSKACPIGCFSLNSDYASYATTSAILQRRNEPNNALPNGNSSHGPKDNHTETGQTSPKKNKKFKFLGVRTKKDSHDQAIEEVPEDTPIENDITPQNSPKDGRSESVTHSRSQSLDSSPSRSTNSSSPSIDMIDNVAYSNNNFTKASQNHTKRAHKSSGQNTSGRMEYTQENVSATRHDNDVNPTVRDVNVVEIVSNEKSPQTTRKDLIRIKDMYPFLQAACNGDVPALRIELEHLSEAEILHLLDESENTALHLAASCGQQECVNVLTKQCPALLTAENKSKLTPLGLAIKHGQIECLDWLLENANVENQLYTTGKRSLLHLAAKFGQDGCLRLLLSKSSAKNGHNPPVDSNGNSPAHLAAKHGHMTCLQSLVEFNADVHSSNHQGQTPCGYAQANHKEDCARYLMLVDTARRLAQDVVNRDRQIERLQHESEDFQKHLKDCLDVNVALLKQLQQDQTRERTIRAMLEECGDLLWDSMEQIQSIFTENCVLKQRYVGEQDNRETRRYILAKIERTKMLRRQLKKMDKSVDQSGLRQYWLKVKDMERELTAGRQMDDVTESDLESQVNHVLNEQITEIFSNHTAALPMDEASSRQEAGENLNAISAITKLSSAQKYLQGTGLNSQDEESTDNDSKDQASNPKEIRYYENVIIRNDIPPIDLSFLNHNLSEDESTIIYENGNDEHLRDRLVEQSKRNLHNSSLSEVIENEVATSPSSKERRNRHQGSYSVHAIPKMATQIKGPSLKRKQIVNAITANENSSGMCTPEIQEIQTDTEMNPDDLDQIESVSQNGDTPTMPTEMWTSSYRPEEKSSSNFTYAGSGGYNVTGAYPSSSRVETNVNIRPVKLDLTYADFKETYARDKVKGTEEEDIDEDEGEDYEDWSAQKPVRNTGPVVENFQSWVKQEVHKFDTTNTGYISRNPGEEPDRREGRYDDEDLYDEDEEILVDPSLRILPSMQFDMNLSTIEEASIVSGSTSRGDEERRPDLSVVGIRTPSMISRLTPTDDKANKSQKTDRAWYDVSDDEDMVPWKRRSHPLQSNEHFTLL